MTCGFGTLVAWEFGYSVSQFSKGFAQYSHNLSANALRRKQPSANALRRKQPFSA